MVVDVFEGRDIATADIGEAFLLADIDNFVVIKVEGEVVDVLCKINPQYSQYVVMQYGTKVLYMQLKKALYGIMKAAVLWYETFCECLKENDFKLNPYDPCIANADIDESQCTICWHVDDCKISHRDPKVVTRIINMLKEKF